MTSSEPIRQGPGSGPIPRTTRRANLVGTAWAMTIVVLPTLTWALLGAGADLPLHIVLFIYLLIAVGVASLGGIGPAITSAVAGFLLANWFFTPPVRTWTIADAADLFSLFTFLVVTTAIGLLVGLASRRRDESARARAQAEELAALSARRDPMPDPADLVKRIVHAFPVSAAAVLKRSGPHWEVIARDGDPEPPPDQPPLDSIRLSDDMVLTVPERLAPGDRRVMQAFALQWSLAMDRARLEREAQAATALAEADRLRTALLRSVSHDLRTPLATIKASVTSLLDTGVAWREEETTAFLTTILDETDRLDRLVGRLLDASRLQAGVVAVNLSPVGLDEVVGAALAGMRAVQDRVEVELPHALPQVATDAALLERVIANLVENAVTFSPPGVPVSITAHADAGAIVLEIADRGPGIAPDQMDRIFLPFQRLGDSPRGDGVGLGLTVTKGLLGAMGTDLTVGSTPGGGTTMSIRLHAAPNRSTRTPR